jgi:hypothetical protein
MASPSGALAYEYNALFVKAMCLVCVCTCLIFPAHLLQERHQGRQLLLCACGVRRNWGCKRVVKDKGGG